MSIGLYDNDLMNHDYDFFNLELMKIAKFYKGRREIVKLSPLFTPDSYTKFILRKDSDLNNLPLISKAPILYTFQKTLLIFHVYAASVKSIKERFCLQNTFYTLTLTSWLYLYRI